MAPDGTNPSCIAHLRSVMRSAKHDATAGRPESITFLAVRARATESRRRRRARPGASNPAANGRDAAIGEAAPHPHPRSEAHAKGREAEHGAPPNRQTTWFATMPQRCPALRWMALPPRAPSPLGRGGSWAGWRRHCAVPLRPALQGTPPRRAASHRPRRASAGTARARPAGVGVDVPGVSGAASPARDVQGGR